MIYETKQSYDDRIKIIAQAVSETQKDIVISDDVEMVDIFKEDDKSEAFEL